MYTRCPECSTIFRVTAAQLRAALGEVSCGSCRTTFNALTALTEDLPELTEAVVLDPIDQPPLEELVPGDSATEELPTDEDDEIEAEVAPAERREPAYDDNTGIEEILDEDMLGVATQEEATEESDPLEFNAPETTWSSIFAPTDSDAATATATAEPPADDTDPGDTDPDPGDADPDHERVDSRDRSPLDSATADQDEWARFLSELTEPIESEDPASQASGDEGAALPNDESREIEYSGQSDALSIGQEPYDERQDDEDGPVVVLGSADDMGPAEDEGIHIVLGEDSPVPAADPLTDYEPGFVAPWEAEPTEAAEQETGRTSISWRQGALVAVLLLALVTQLIHYNRDSLAANSSWGPQIRAIYATLGTQLYPNWSLDSYRVSGSEAVAGRTAPAALDIMANVVVTAEDAVGMPMIRVALRDRWSNPIASRVFSPAEYLSDFETWPQMLSPGMSLPVDISVADPGTDAHGYIIDVCLPRRTSGLQCQLEKDPFKQ